MENKQSDKSKIGETWGVRRIGYIVVIAIMFVLLYIFKNLYNWGVPFITEEYNKLIFYIELSVYATIIIHAIFLVFDPKWFRHLLKAFANMFSTLSTIMFYVIYPFDFPGNWDRTGKIILLVLVILSIIGIISELAKAIKYLLKAK